jgi:hypothetical protein
MLQSDMVKVSGALTIIGLHSGYKLTRLEGRFDDPTQEANAKHSVVTLNDGDDSFFHWTQLLNSILAPFIDAAYGNAVIDGAGNYNIYVSQASQANCWLAFSSSAALACWHTTGIPIFKMVRCHLAPVVNCSLRRSWPL